MIFAVFLAISTVWLVLAAKQFIDLKKKQVNHRMMTAEDAKAEALLNSFKAIRKKKFAYTTFSDNSFEKEAAVKTIDEVLDALGKINSSGYKFGLINFYKEVKERVLETT